MDYERIGKTQVSFKCFSITLYSILETGFCVRLGKTESKIWPASGSDDCKYVDVVTEITDSSTSATVLGDLHDYDNVNEIKSLSTASLFEFQKTEKEKTTPRMSIRSFSKPAPSKWDDAQKWIASPTSNRPKTGQVQAHASKKGPSFGRQSSIKIVDEEPDTKRVDVSQVKKETGGHKFVSWEVDSYLKPVLMVENSATEVNLSRHDSSMATAFAQPPSTARSVSMRDMGTEMTPIASQEPSRNGTPIRATTPIRSPVTSAPSSPGRRALSNEELSEKEIQMKTRREIMVLGTQLGKLNIAAWASKEDEEKDASTSQTSKSVSEVRASAWEEAEKAKHMARIKGRAQDRLMNKIAEIERKAEEKRAAAEAKKNREAAKTEKQAEEIRRTGKVPSLLFSCSSFCS
ncbi:hypothetical protein F2Q68_00011273 [Brassica cretica]|uniref:Remorin C-terminal domain-containing protein n=1 Tax=Brassica cretica TaxID=69181 RepID=A0A8S9L1Z9_BRACR|nr:hypothetical protein F2Q68_00011273 [Brassica cretica]